MENREMFDEINALIGAVAKALDTSETDVITAIEQGRLAMEMLVDEKGQNYLAVSCDDKEARVYPGAIYRAGDRPDAIDPAAIDEDEDCGGGCTCGH